MYSANMTVPNFIIIGAAKSGTTALYHYLEQHPQIYMSPKKETNFFALEAEKLYFPDAPQVKRTQKPIDNITAYCDLFRGVADETAVGEASPWYLYHPGVPERIQHYLPDAKLIAILRNPVERAYSHFLNSVRDGAEPFTDFAQALQEEEVRVHNNLEPLRWHYQQMGFYYVQVKRYFETFDRNQIRIYLYDDLKDGPTGLLQDIFQYLAVDDTFAPNMSTRFNMSGFPKSQALHTFLKKKHPIKSVLKPFLPKELRLQITSNLQNRNLEKPAPLSLEMRQRLVELYREDILKLQDLIQRDLAKWLK